jgi:two-component system response regulator VicR
MKRILLVEDDTSIQKGLVDVLTTEHFQVLTAGTGERGAQTARRENIDLIILDLGLPDMDGADLCSALRRDGITTPVLMLTSRGQEMDKVLGLELGADDYMTKPFSVRELVARVRALLRRQAPLIKTIEDIAFGHVEVDFRKQDARKNGVPVKLSSREFEVLRYLIQHAGEVVTRDMLLNEVWGYEQFPTTRTVDNYILSLRKKLEDDPAEPVYLQTVHTSGYRFVPDAGLSGETHESAASPSADAGSGREKKREGRQTGEVSRRRGRPPSRSGR